MFLFTFIFSVIDIHMSRADDAEDAEVDKILDSVDGAEAKLDDSMRVELNTLILETVSDDFLRTDRPSGHLTSDPILLKYQRSVIFHMLKTAGKTLFQVCVLIIFKYHIIL